MSLRARIRAVSAVAPRAYWVVWWGTLVNRLGNFVVPLLAIYLTTQRGASVSDAGAAVSTFGGGQVLASIVGGHLADRVGRRVTMVASLAMGACTMLVLGTLRDITAITIVVGVLGFVGELYRPAVSAFVADVVPEGGRTEAYGLLYWAVNMGWAVAATVGGLVAGRDFQLLFVLDAATSLAFCVLVLAMVPETRPPPAPHGTPPSIAWWRDRPFLVFVGIDFLQALIPMQAGATLSIHMTAQGFTPAEYGLAIAANGVLIILLQPYLTALLAKRDPERVLVAAALIYGSGFALHGLGSVLVLHLAAVLVWTVGEILESPTRSALVAAMAPADARGRYQGAFVMVWGAAQLVAPRLGTQVWDDVGPGAPWLGCLVIGIFVAIALAGTAPARRARVGSR